MRSRNPPVLTDPVGAFSHYADGQASNSASRLRRSRRSDGCGRSVRREQARAGAALAEARLHPLGHPADELGRVRGARRILDVRVARVEAAVADVLADGVAEEDRLLRHDGDLLAQGTHRDLADVSTIDAHAAGNRVVETADEVHEGGLPRSRWADERGRF